MRERQLFSGPLFDIAEFACPPQDEAWRDVNVIESASPLVVFPHSPSAIRADGSAPVLATPNLVMLYNPGQEYERRLHDARGDECLYIALHPHGAGGARAEGGAIRDGRMTATHAPAERLAYLQQHLLGRHLRGAAPDALLVEETTMRLVRSVVRSAGAGATREQTAASHVALTESAKELLATSLAEPLGLHERRGAPRRLAVPPRARVPQQRRASRSTQYRTQLRLRLALERLPESARRTDLARVRARLREPQPLHRHVPPRVRRRAVGRAGRPQVDACSPPEASTNAEASTLAAAYARAVAGDFDFWVGEWDAPLGRRPRLERRSRPSSAAPSSSSASTAGPGPTLQGLSVSVYDASASAGGRPGSTRSAATSTSRAVSATTASWSSGTRARATEASCRSGCASPRSSASRSSGSGSAKTRRERGASGGGSSTRDGPDDDAMARRRDPPPRRAPGCRRGEARSAMPHASSATHSRR